MDLTILYLFHTTTRNEPIRKSISANICSWFSSNGYSAYNGFGQTYKNTVLGVTQDAESDQYVATVWFDHGVGTNETISGNHTNELHFMLCDQNGNTNNHDGNVYDYMIYDTTTPNHNYFSYITACMSAALSLVISLAHKLLRSGSYGL